MHSFLDISPVFRAIARVQNARQGLHQWVTPEARMLIEGFPRSSNTYLHRIVRAAVLGDVKIGHHVHRPQQITQALRYDIPVFLLVRKPLDCIASLMVFNPKVTAVQGVRRYIAFSERALAHADDTRVHIISFESLVADPVLVANRVLDTAGVSHGVDATLVKEATRDNRAQKSRSSLPNRTKDQLKAKHIEAITNLPRFDEAHAFYEALIEKAWHLDGNAA